MMISDPVTGDPYSDYLSGAGPSGPNPPSPETSSASQAPASQAQNGSASNVVFGDGWDDGANDPEVQKLKAALSTGLWGEAAVQAAGLGAYYEANQTIGLAHYYVSRRANGMLDLVKRPTGSSASTANVTAPAQSPFLSSFLSGQPITSNVPTFTPTAAPTPNPLIASGINTALTSPSLSPSVVSQMKEKAKEDTLGQARQLKSQLLTSAVSRGLSPGGTVAPALQNVDRSVLGALSSSNRALDVQAAEQNRTDLLNALGIANQYQNTLFNEWQQTNDLNMSAQDRAFQQWLSTQGINLSYAQLAQAGLLGNLNYQLAVMQFLAGGA